MDILTIDEVTQLKGVAASTLQRWCREGYIPGAEKKGKTWFIPVGSIEKLPTFKRGRKTKSRDN